MAKLTNEMREEMKLIVGTILENLDDLIGSEDGEVVKGILYDEHGGFHVDGMGTLIRYIDGDIDSGLFESEE